MMKRLGLMSQEERSVILDTSMMAPERLEFYTGSGQWYQFHKGMCMSLDMCYRLKPEIRCFRWKGGSDVPHYYVVATSLPAAPGWEIYSVNGETGERNTDLGNDRYTITLDSYREGNWDETTLGEVEAYCLNKAEERKAPAVIYLKIKQSNLPKDDTYAFTVLYKGKKVMGVRRDNGKQEYLHGWLHSTYGAYMRSKTSAWAPATLSEYQEFMRQFETEYRLYHTIDASVSVIGVAIKDNRIVDAIGLRKDVLTYAASFPILNAYREINSGFSVCTKERYEELKASILTYQVRLANMWEQLPAWATHVFFGKSSQRWCWGTKPQVLLNNGACDTYVYHSADYADTSGCTDLGYPARRYFADFGLIPRSLEPAPRIDGNPWTPENSQMKRPLGAYNVR